MASCLPLLVHRRLFSADLRQGSLVQPAQSRKVEFCSCRRVFACRKPTLSALLQHEDDSSAHPTRLSSYRWVPEPLSTRVWGTFEPPTWEEDGAGLGLRVRGCSVDARGSGLPDASSLRMSGVFREIGASDFKRLVEAVQDFPGDTTATPELSAGFRCTIRHVRKHDQYICILPSLCNKLNKVGDEVVGEHAMQRSLVWKKLGDLLNGVIMTAVWMTGVWRRRVDNQSYIRNYPRLGTPVAEMAVEADEGAEGVELAAETAYLHVGEDVTRARTRRSDTMQRPQGLRASIRGLIQTRSVRRREFMPCVAWDSVGR